MFGHGNGGVTPDDESRTIHDSILSKEELSRFKLDHEDGIVNRRRELQSRLDRIRVLNLTEHDCGCGLKFYYPADENDLRQKICPSCDFCIKCHLKKMVCQCKVKGKLRIQSKKMTPCRRFTRILWRYATLFGLLVAVYESFFGTLMYPVLTSVLVSQSVQETNYFAQKVLSNVSIPIDRFDLNTTMVTGLYTIVVIILTFSIFNMIQRTVDTFQSRKSREQILKRRRYDDLETNRMQINCAAFSTTMEYFSDDDRLGMDDPDIAFLNLTQEDKRKDCWVRCCRRVTLF